MKLRGKLPGLNYTPKLRIKVYLKMSITKKRKNTVQRKLKGDKKGIDIEERNIDIFKYTLVVEEHSIVGRR